MAFATFSFHGQQHITSCLLLILTMLESIIIIIIIITNVLI